MPSVAIYEIPTADLEIGSALPFDLRGPDGNIVHKSGLPITQRLLDRLQTLGVSTVTVRGATESQVDVKNILLNAYDPQVVEEVNERMDTTVRQLDKVFQQLLSALPIEIDSLQRNVAQFVENASSNTSAVLGVVVSRMDQNDEGLFDALASRSARRAYVAVVNAVGLGCEVEEATRVGTLAMLSDIALVQHPDWFDANHRLIPSVMDTEEYKNYTVESARIVKETTTMDDEFIESMAQIQEQADGSGSPYGLTADVTMEASKIVNLIDKYLLLSDPTQRVVPYLEADVVAYLMYQTGKGRFDKSIIRGFVRTLSMYPIGSLVRLDDDSCAIVLEANQKNPFQPIVKSVDPTGRVKDLSKSPNFIVGPAVEKSHNRCRIEKSKMDEVLWSVN